MKVKAQEVKEYDDYDIRMGLADIPEEDIRAKTKDDVVAGIQKIKAFKGEHSLYRKEDKKRKPK